MGIFRKSEKCMGIYKNKNSDVIPVVEDVAKITKNHQTINEKLIMMHKELLFSSYSYNNGEIENNKQKISDTFDSIMDLVKKEMPLYYQVKIVRMIVNDLAKEKERKLNHLHELINDEVF